MLKLCWLAMFIFLYGQTIAQPLLQKMLRKNNLTDSTRSVQGDGGSQLPMILLDENEDDPHADSHVPTVLTAGRDVFLTAAAFHFSITRFRTRGYDGKYSGTQFNGVPVNNPGDGITPWLWGGLTDVIRNVQVSIGLRNHDLSFGNIGDEINIDARAWKQKEQTQFSYALANRSYQHRVMFTHTKGMNAKGWSYSISGSTRYGSEGFVPGTAYSSGSYFLAVDKRLSGRDILSLVWLGASTVNGMRSAVAAEVAALLQTHYYNSYWGYQSGHKRNASTAFVHEPLLVITFDHHINNQSSWLTSAGFITGTKSSTALDWYKAADPRPDYYRYLPGYQADSVLQLAVADAFRKNARLQQVNWAHLYDVNRMHTETTNGADGNAVTGLRAHYILEERVMALRRFIINSVFKAWWKPGVYFTAGASMQLQKAHYYKRVKDLLGAQYYVDWNQYAQTGGMQDENIIQNDLNRPDRILHEGDQYGYDYYALTTTARGWAQVMVSKRRIDFSAAAEISYTNYQRKGNTRFGLFPYISFGLSALNEFSGYGIKTGITYKINGRKYLYLHAAVMSAAPLFDDVYISPRTRDTRQETIRNETVLSAECGYIWNAPGVKLRLTGYLTRFRHGMNVTTFYHDGFHGFVNYAMSNIGKLHAGMELGCELRLTAHFTMDLAAAIGSYYYDTRQKVTVSSDNDDALIERSLVYAKNFRVPGTPQQAFNTGFSYRSSGSFYCNLSASYFRRLWIDFNPLRRTYSALQGVMPGSDQWNDIIRQSVVPDQYSLDLSAGTAARIRLRKHAQRNSIRFNISINNILNNRDIISGGYEQLRFDTETKNIARFPPKFYYASGLTFSAGIVFRL